MSSVREKVKEALPRWSMGVAPVMLAVVLATYVFIRIGYRDIPLERDEGVYVYMGGLLLEGGVPYVDFFEARPPGLYYTYALLYAISGGDLAWMHVWMALFTAVGALFFHGLARSWLESGSALAATVTYSALSMSFQASGFTLQSEHFVVLFIVAGLYVLDHALSRERPWAIALAGMLICWAVSIKQNAVFLAVFAIAYMFIAYPAQRGWRTRLRYLVFLAAGAAVPLIAFLLVMRLQGSLAEFWFWMTKVSLYYVDTILWKDGIDGLRTNLGILLGGLDSMIPWVVGLTGCALLWKGERPGWQRLAMAMFLLASILTVVPGLRFFGHYFLMFFPALALCAGHFVQVSATWAAERLRPGGRIHFQFLFAASLFGIILLQQHQVYFKVDHTSVLRRVYGINPFPEARLVADEINARIEPGDGVFVMGFEPQIYLYTGTRSPTRWVNTTVLMVAHPFADSARNEVRAALAASPPRFVVWVRHYISWMPLPDADTSFLEEYWHQLERDYEVIAWYEQDPPLVLHAATGEAARYSAPRGGDYVLLAERKETLYR